MCIRDSCTNVELKLRIVNSTAARINNSRIRHIFHTIDIITCGRQAGGATSWKQACAVQQCDNCSVDQLDLHLQPLQHQGLVTWTKWESVPRVVNGKRVCFFPIKFASLWKHIMRNCSHSSLSVCYPRREAGDVWCLPPVWNLRAVIWFHFAISSLALLPSPVTLSVLSFSACWPFLLNFFLKILQYFSLRDRLFCIAPV